MQRAAIDSRISPALLVHVNGGVVVSGFDPAADVAVELAHGAVSAALEQLGGQLGKPALDGVQPRCAGRREMQREARMGGEPALDRWRVVGGGVVKHEVNVEPVGNLAVDRLQEA